MLQNVVLGKIIQEKKFWGPLLTILGDIQVAIWKFGLNFLWLFYLGICCAEIFWINHLCLNKAKSLVIILSYLNKCHYFKRFLHNKFPNKIATKILAQISMWQLNFLMKLTKDDKKLNWSCSFLPKSMPSIINLSWTLLVFRVHPFFMIYCYKIAIFWRNL